MSMAKQVKLFVGAMNRAAQRKESSYFTTEVDNNSCFSRSQWLTQIENQEIASLISQLRLEVPSVGDFVEVLNQQNYILKKGARLYQLQTSLYSQGRY